LSSLETPVPVEDFVQGVDEFVPAVIERLGAYKLRETQLASLWPEICGERRDPRRSAWRKMEALFGCDPDESPHTVVQELLDQGAIYGERAIEKVRFIMDEGRRQAFAIRVPGGASLRQRLHTDAGSKELPWQKAEMAAQVAREQWNLGTGPISSKTLGESAATPSNFSVGFRENPEEERYHVYLGRRNLTSRRFGLIRLVADQFAGGPAERFFPATEMKTARQKFQRAFAREFLCPFQALSEFLGDNKTDERIEDAAGHFDVSPLLIKTTLLNKGAIERGR
jgi:hypothetical protein